MFKFSSTPSCKWVPAIVKALALLSLPSLVFWTPVQAEVDRRTGHFFLVAFPSYDWVTDPNQASIHLGLSTLEPETVTVVIDSKYSKVKIKFTSEESQQVEFYWRDRRRVGPVGAAISIDADRYISVMAMFTPDGRHLSTTYLPPAQNFACSYHLYVARTLTLLLVMTRHSGTIVRARARLPISANVKNYYKKFILESKEYLHIRLTDYAQSDFFLTSSRPVYVMIGNNRTLATLRPVTAYGNHYVLLQPSPLRAKLARFAYVVQEKQDWAMAVEVVDKGLVAMNGILSCAESGCMIPYVGDYPEAMIVHMSRPVVVMTGMQTHFQSSLCLPIPTSNFPNQVFFRLPTRVAYTNTSYLYLILHATEKEEFVFNGLPMEKQKWTYLGIQKNGDQGENLFKYTRRPIMNMDVAVRHQDYRVHFGAYLWGGNDVTDFRTELVLSRSFSSPKPQQGCKDTTMKPGDFLDNDCDGRVDEEEFNGRDDDGDGLVDEDEFGVPVDGGWGEWEAWSCPKLCNPMENVTRKRTCSNPHPRHMGKICVGKVYDSSDTRCMWLFPNCYNGGKRALIIAMSVGGIAVLSTSLFGVAYFYS